MLFEEHLLEQMRRVQQPPKMLKNSGGPKGKSDLSEQIDRGINFKQDYSKIPVKFPVRFSLLLRLLLVEGGIFYV